MGPGHQCSRRPRPSHSIQGVTIDSFAPGLVRRANQTCIIATVSPVKSNLEETISTLDYAFRAKNIRNKPQLNVPINKKMLLQDMAAKIEQLKCELISTRQLNGVYLTNEIYEDLIAESEVKKDCSRRTNGQDWNA